MTTQQQSTKRQQPEGGSSSSQTAKRSRQEGGNSAAAAPPPEHNNTNTSSQPTSALPSEAAAAAGVVDPAPPPPHQAPAPCATRLADVCDTVGALVVDALGQVAAGVSSGGLALKTEGRVGEAAVTGAGCWADDGTWWGKVGEEVGARGSKMSAAQAAAAAGSAAGGGSVSGCQHDAATTTPGALPGESLQMGGR